MHRPAGGYGTPGPSVPGMDVDRFRQARSEGLRHWLSNLQNSGLIVRAVPHVPVCAGLSENAIERLCPVFVFRSPGDGGPIPLEGCETERPGKQENDMVLEAACPVCLENYKRDDRIRRLPCRHAFHADCVATWLHRSTCCPMCKQRVDKPSSAATLTDTALVPPAPSHDVEVPEDDGEDLGMREQHASPTLPAEPARTLYPDGSLSRPDSTIYGGLDRMEALRRTRIWAPEDVRRAIARDRAFRPWKRLGFFFRSRSNRVRPNQLR